MKKKVMLILSCLFISIGFITAQTTSISGTVVDEVGEPVIGASVVVKGTTIGVATDVDGRFTIGMPQGQTMLEISLIGMKTVESRAINGMRVTMVTEENVLQEVEISVPYGTTRKASYTGAAGIVGSEVMKDVPAMSFEKALQGAAPGITIQSSSGQPGSQQSIILRGQGSVNASTQPLYVIDGIPMIPENLSVSGVSGSAGSLGISGLLATADIENVTILKDAAATSMYGSRGGNGVIIITTKNGSAGKTQVSLKASVGFSDWAVNNRPMLRGDQIRELWTESTTNYFMDNGATEEEARVAAERQVDMVAPYPADGRYYDWEDALFRSTGTVQNYDATVSGGNDKTKFFVSLGYKDEKGMAANSWAKQYTGRINLLHEVNRLKMGFTMSISKLDKNRVAEGTAFANPYYATRSYLFPTTPIYNDDGTYYNGPLLNNHANLKESQNLDQYLLKVFNTRASGWVEWNIIDNLKLKQTLSYDFSDTNSTTIWPSNSSNGANANGLIIKINPERQKLYSSTILSYDKTIGLHNFDVLLGWDAEKQITTSLQAVGEGFASPNITELAGAATPTTAYSVTNNDRMLSFISRANYSYNDKYYLSGSLRRDGSSRFGANKRWGTFWSASGAWRISGEEFMSGASDVLRDLKLRASVGESGNLPAGLYESQDTYTIIGSYMGRPATYPARIANPDLSWEKVLSWNIGLDVNLFNKLSLEFDYYVKDTKDLIASVPLPLSTGFTSYVANMGKLKNTGFEFGIGFNAVSTKDFMWFTKLNLAYNKMEVTEVYGGALEHQHDSFFITRKGESYWSFYMREYAGINRETGAEQWYKNTTLEDGSIDRSVTEDPNEASRIIVDKADPDVTGGWMNTLTYKGFELSTLFSFSLGGKFIDTGWPSVSGGMYDLSMLPAHTEYDRWQKPGDNTTAGRRVVNYQYGNYTSSKWIHSTNHIRLKNVSLAYTLPRELTRKIDMSTVRFTVSATNLFTIKSADGFDPEVPYGYQVGYEFPPLKEIMFGVEITF